MESWAKRKTQNATRKTLSKLWRWNAKCNWNAKCTKCETQTQKTQNATRNMHKTQNAHNAHRSFENATSKRKRPYVCFRVQGLVFMASGFGVWGLRVITRLPAGTKLATSSSMPKRKTQECKTQKHKTQKHKTQSKRKTHKMQNAICKTQNARNAQFRPA